MDFSERHPEEVISFFLRSVYDAIVYLTFPDHLFYYKVFEGFNGEDRGERGGLRLHRVFFLEGVTLKRAYAHMLKWYTPPDYDSSTLCTYIFRPK